MIQEASGPAKPAHPSEPVLIGQSPAISTVISAAVRVARSEAAVLIEGETGTGKELFAQLIHVRSRRYRRPFISHNCGVTPDTLIENELFGHARGAFTGAHRDQRGLFEMADGGTLFLDEIADVSQMTQSKLLRVLQEGEFRRVGEMRFRRADVRLIAATNRPLEGEVRAGRFRPDLFYRLHVVTLSLPPLRERREDIAPLVRHFVRAVAAAEERPEIQLESPALAALCRYSWPGNVRELENEIRRLTALWAGERVCASQLSERIRVALLVRQSRGGGERRGLHGAVQALEERLIIETLVRMGGNKSRVARHLGLSRQGLAKKMRRYGLDGMNRDGDVPPDPLDSDGREALEREEGREDAATAAIGGPDEGGA